MTMISLWTVLAVAPYVALCGVLLLYMRFNAAARRSAPVRVGQWVAITGAASGIGKETALAILRGGGSVWAIDLTHEALERGLSAAAAEHGERLRMAAADVTDDKAIRNLAARIEKETGLLSAVCCLSEESALSCVFAFSVRWNYCIVFCLKKRKRRKTKQSENKKQAKNKCNRC